MKNKPALTTIIIWVGAALAGAALTWYKGVDLNWDLRNYHLYNVWALFHDRWGHDLEVAYHPGFYNPFFDLPFYFLFKTCSPFVASLVMGAFHGLNVAFLWLAMRTVFRKENLPAVTTLVLGVSAAIVAFRSPAMWAEIGGVFNDNVVSLFMLGSLVMLLSTTRTGAEEAKRNVIKISIAGFLAGLGVGGKYTALVFGLSLGVAMWIATVGNRKYFWKSTFGFCVAGIVGFSLAAGPWLLRLWLKFGNPTFPMLNNVFKSEWAPPFAYSDSRYKPESFWDAFKFPLYMLNDHKSKHMSENSFSTPWAAILVGVALSILVYFLIKILSRVIRRKAAAKKFVFTSSHRNYAMVFTFAGLSYVLWLKLFGYYRYLVALEVICPLLLYMLLNIIVKRPRIAAWGTVLVCVASLFFLEPFYRRRGPFTETWFNIKEKVDIPNNTMVLLPEMRTPVGYIPPHLPESIRYIRVRGHVTWPGWQTPWQQRVEQTIRDHTGPVYALGTSPKFLDGLKTTLESYGFELANIDRVRILDSKDRWPCFFKLQAMERVETSSVSVPPDTVWASIPRHAASQLEPVNFSGQLRRPHSLGSKTFYSLTEDADLSISNQTEFLPLAKYPVEYVQWDETFVFTGMTGPKHQLIPRIQGVTPFRKIREPIEFTLPMRLGPNCGELIVADYYYKPDPDRPEENESDTQRIAFEIDGETYVPALKGGRLLLPWMPAMQERASVFYPITLVPPALSQVQLKKIKLSPLNRRLNLDVASAGSVGWHVRGQVVRLPDSPNGKNWIIRDATGQIVSEGRTSSLPTREENTFDITIPISDSSAHQTLTLEGHAFWVETVEITAVEAGN